MTEHPMSTLATEDFLNDDELEFARETLGPDADDTAVLNLALDRARVLYAEYVAELDKRFSA